MSASAETTGNRKRDWYIVSGEARRRGFNEKLALDLFRMGELVIGDNNFSLDIARGEKEAVIFYFDGNRGHVTIWVDNPSVDRAPAELNKLPASRVVIEEIFYPEGAGFKAKAVFAVADFGILGDMKFGVTSTGEIVVRSNLR